MAAAAAGMNALAVAFRFGTAPSSSGGVLRFELAATVADPVFVAARESVVPFPLVTAVAVEVALAAGFLSVSSKSVVAPTGLAAGEWVRST